MLNFASDNWAGAHPRILDAVVRCNDGNEPSYGADSYSEALDELVRRRFGAAATAYPVFNGTGANVVALDSIQPPWGAVVCCDRAHINTDEAAAPERVAGLKLLPIPSADAKLNPEDIVAAHVFIGNEHHAQATAVSVTESTELGTVYTRDELAAIVTTAHGLGMKVHMDGARLCNAAATLGESLQSLTADVGVDILSFGGTKNGLLYGELVVVLDPSLDEGVRFIRKINMQLASKMRYISAQFIALLEGDLWEQTARVSNEKAAMLRRILEERTPLTFTQATQANAVFAVLPPRVARELRDIASFQTWNPNTNEVRFMCSFATTDLDVKQLSEAIIGAMG